MSILVLTSDTLIGTPATGNIEYNGQFFGTDSNASRAQMQRITQGTAVASTSGTSIDFTGLPAWVKRITVMLNGVSTNGASNFLIQIGTSSGIENTGYTSAAGSIGNSLASSTAGFIITQSNSAAYSHQAVVVITSLGSANTWMASGVDMIGGSTGYSSTGSKALAGTLDRVRITSVTPDTFDAGSINILYEG
jgi:hypothetical protein